MLIKVANEVSTTNNFKLIQLPFNIVERNASVKSEQNNRSVIDIAKEYGIVTFSNRPFNANDSDGLNEIVNIFRRRDT